jgi:hypothetical protein
MVYHELIQHDVLITLLIVHGLAAFLLLGALTHQAIAVWVPPHSRVHDFPGYIRAVAATHYVNACIAVYLVTFILGVVIYPDYKLTSLEVLDHQHWIKTLRGFEYKEDALGLGLALLPAYWYFWQPPLAKEHALTRAMVTSMLAFVAWWSFLLGHLANNVAGLGVRP